MFVVPTSGIVSMPTSGIITICLKGFQEIKVSTVFQKKVILRLIGQVLQKIPPLATFDSEIKRRVLLHLVFMFQSTAKSQRSSIYLPLPIHFRIIFPLV